MPIKDFNGEVMGVAQVSFKDIRRCTIIMLGTYRVI